MVWALLQAEQGATNQYKSSRIDGKTEYGGPGTSTSVLADMSCSCEILRK